MDAQQQQQQQSPFVAADDEAPYVMVLTSSPLGIYARNYKTLLDNEDHLPCTMRLASSAQVVYGSALFARDARNKDRCAERRAVYKSLCGKTPFEECTIYSSQWTTAPGTTQLPLYALICLPTLCKEAVESAATWAKRTVLKDSAFTLGTQEYKDVRVWELCGLLRDQTLLRDSTVPAYYQSVQVFDHEATLCALVLLLANSGIKSQGVVVYVAALTNRMVIASLLYNWQVCAAEALSVVQAYISNLEMQKHSRVFTTTAAPAVDAPPPPYGKTLVDAAIAVTDYSDSSAATPAAANLVIDTKEDGENNEKPVSENCRKKTNKK